MNNPNIEPDPEPAPDITRNLAIGLMIAGIVLALVLRWDRIGAASYKKIEEVLPNLLMVLGVTAAILERSLAVVNAALSGEEKERWRARKYVAASQYDLARRVALAKPAPDQLVAAYDQHREAAVALTDASVALAAVEAKQQRVRVVLGFLVGLVVAAVGVRTLAMLLTPAGTTKVIDLFTFADIVITAGILAGGSDGIAKLTQLIEAILKKPKMRLEMMP